MNNDTSYVNLSLEKYNELYDKAKKFDKLYEKYKDKYDEVIDKAVETLTTWLDSLPANKEVATTDETVTTEDTWHIGQRIKVINYYNGEGTIKDLTDTEALIDFDDKNYKTTWYDFNEIEKLENKSEEEK